MGKSKLNIGLAGVIQFLERQLWTFPRFSDKYERIFKDKLDKYDRDLFDLACMYIRLNGFSKPKLKYVYYIIGAYKYWTLKDPLSDNYILSRTKIGFTRNRRK